MLVKRLAFLGIALLAFVTVALTGLGSFFRDVDPARALSYNPFDGEARAQFVGNAVADSAELERSVTVALNGIRFAPIDARMHSLLAEVQRQQGARREAKARYEAALSLSKTESLALQRTLQTALEQGDFSSAMEKLDILFRRWPSAFDSFSPAVPYILRDPSGFKVALEMLQQDPPWRSLFLGVLNRSPETLDMAYRMLLELNEDGSRTDESARTQQALLRNRDYVRAFRLFLLSQSDEDRQNYGYIFNGKFALEPSDRPFDWYVTNTPGVSLERAGRDVDGERDYRLVIHFLGKPVRRIGLSQVVLLPPGDYRLNIEADATDLKAPKGLYFNLSCIDPRAEVARLDIPSGSYRAETLQAEFTVPDGECKVLQLDMRTDLSVESFRYGYSGTLSIDSVSISRST